MPFDNSGNFNRTFPPGGWQGDAAAQIKIKADRHDQHDKDLADGLSNVICRDGQSQIVADIPWNSHKIINLANGVNPQDAATVNQLQALRTFSTGIVISGSTTNGQITFTGGTGPTGLSWTVPDISYGATGAAGSGQWVWNDKADGTGTNVMVLTENGSGAWALNLKSTLDTAGQGPNVTLDRFSPTPAAGDVLGSINFTGNDSTLAGTTYGQIHGYINDPTNGSEDGALYFNVIVAGTPATRLALNEVGAFAYGTLTATGAITSAQEFTSSTTAVCLNTSGAGAVYLRPNGQGNGGGQTIIDSNGLMNVGGSQTVNGNTHATGRDSCANSYWSHNHVFAGNGAMYFRPNGPDNDTSRMTLDANGGLRLAGAGAHFNLPGTVNLDANAGVLFQGNFKCKHGANGGYAAFMFNWVWDGVHNYSYIDNTNIGWVTVNSDYRIKKDVADLPSTWDRIKALRPISYTQKEYTPSQSATVKAAVEENSNPDPQAQVASGPLFRNDDEEQWGFIAHEAQETLTLSAATGTKDCEDMVQSLNWSPILAATVKALQEAMTRIEALEAQIAGMTP